MSKEYAKGTQALFALAEEDPRYAKLSGRQGEAQKRVEKILQQLPTEEQDLVWDYICRAEEMNWLMLEILCARYGIED